MSWLTDSRKEYRVLWLYAAAVLIYGLLANVGTPVVEVIWDSVFYKTMAFQLHDWRHFDIQNNEMVPPLYPLALSFASFAKGYLTVETLIAWLNPALYFLGLFPLYRLTRRFVGPGESLSACCLYLFYPAAVFTQWTLSENLAAPLSMLMFWLAAIMLTEDRPNPLLGIALGLTMAASCLTRVQALCFCGAILLWLGVAVWRLKQPAWAWLLAVLSGAGAWLGTCYAMGYFGLERDAAFYIQWDSPDWSNAAGLARTFFSILFAHAAGLWIEGGCLLFALLLAHVVISLFFPSRLPRAVREYGLLVGFTAFTALAGVAAYYILRERHEQWSVSVRYLFYLNQAFIPLAIWWLARLPRITVGDRFVIALVYAASVALLAAMLFGTDVWSVLSRSHEYFTNAPSLDFMSQIDHEGAMTGALLFGAISLIAGIFWLSSRSAGYVILAALLFYLQGAALDQAMNMRRLAADTLWANGIHSFCHEYESGKWRDYPVYCEEDFEFIRPNLLYWIDLNTAPWPEDSPPAPPFYLLTTQPHDGLGALLFDRDGLRLYFAQPQTP
ncbi:MAG: hypothetical protein GC154_19345 [bacterium]|nr:hypothetical protein [bacterium]